MRRLALGIILVLFLLAGTVYWRHNYVEPVPKPEIWGLSDPPSLANMSWEKRGTADVLIFEGQNAPRLYGEVLEELQDLGYTMLEGNWSRTECQWSLWEGRNESYYIAYNGTRFLAIRGPREDVLRTSSREWLCGRPSGSSIAVVPGPWKAAEILALALGSKLMERNVSIAPANWTGPVPDWYLAKFSFRANVGEGVEVLILVYSSKDQVKYAEYLMKKEDRSIKFLRNDGGNYYALIALRGRKADVDKAVEIIQS